VLLCAVGARMAAAQGAASSPALRPSAVEATAGSELEQYYRVLQLDGSVPLYPWTVREFSPAELDRLRPQRPDPWGLSETSAHGASSWWSISLMRPRLLNVYNTSYPFTFNDGAIWAGRGLTTSLDGGVVVRSGPLSVTVAPTIFTAQNAAFSIVNVTGSGTSPFANAQLSNEIDLPQRFGGSRYSRVTWGQSAIRLEALGIAAGVSAADQTWGPGIVSPLVLSDNAEGFPHAYIGTARPWPIGIGQLHGRVEIGELSRSVVARTDGDTARRMMAGIVASFLPRGIPGLELGASRFFHRRESPSGLRFSDFSIPFQGFTSGSINGGQKYDPLDPSYSPENQLASVFFRWAQPASHVEVYGEYMRNDRNYDTRDLILEPDHDAAYMLGFQKVFRRGEGGTLMSVHAEVVNAEVSHLARVRGQAWPYQHSPLTDGHTNRGQVLGAFLAEQGGGGAVAGVDWYRPEGRFGLELMRAVRAKTQGEGAPIDGWDVLHVLSAESTRRARGVELFTRAAAMIELNRNFQKDQGNLSLAVGVRCPCSPAGHGSH
jgi:hypothetical protein